MKPRPKIPRLLAPLAEAVPVEAIPVPAGYRDTKTGRFLPGNRSGALNLRILSRVTGTCKTDLARKEYKPFRKFRQVYVKQRLRELRLVMGGELSTGVHNLIETSSHNLARSRFWEHQFETTLDREAAALAYKFSEASRANEVAAWELARREADARGVIAAKRMTHMPDNTLSAPSALANRQSLLERLRQNET